MGKLVKETGWSMVSSDVLGIPMKWGRPVCGSMEGATMELNKQAVEGDRLKLDWNLAPAVHVTLDWSLNLSRVL